MKRRYRLILIFGLLVLLYFWASKNRRVAIDLNETVSTEGGKRLQLIAEQIRLEKEKARVPTTPPRYGSVTSAAPISKVSEKSCWEKIQDQYQTNPNFLDESREQLNAIVGNWYYMKSDPHSSSVSEEFSPQGKFLLALAKAGLLEGLKMEQDEDLALKLFEQVAVSDPLNSAPFLYAAILEDKRGNRERAEELLKEANQSTHFNSYLKDFTFALFDGVRTTSDYLTALEVWSTSPVPNYIALRNILKKQDQSNIARQLVEDGLRFDRDRITDLSWIPIEYAIGKKLLDSYGTGANIPEYRDLLSKNQSTLEESAERVVSKLDSTCDLESIKDEVENVRKYLDEARTQGL